VRSKETTGNPSGRIVGRTVTKDMSIQSSTPPVSTTFAPFAIGSQASGTASRSAWADWGDDIFDGVSFYVYTEDHQFHWPILNPINTADGVLNVQPYSMFGKDFTITHGYPTLGIFRIDITCSDPTFKFGFGFFGNMGSDSRTSSSTVDTTLTISDGNAVALRYWFNSDTGAAYEKFYMYPIPYEPNVAFSTLGKSADTEGFYTPLLVKGVNVYMSKTNLTLQWIADDLYVTT
jgi:hypothetical protein